ncbi:hypothetical protein QVD17_36664 [Tagetes erecta]|uniref:Uncharacterized protein n=1 Tax=Tagetes erecta TaxID=13708 RepID=A0AAD8NJ65_TARER|nr:hypothetical protein QVD17_36664 [Tagetes erecta]
MHLMGLFYEFGLVNGYRPNGQHLFLTAKASMNLYLAEKYSYKCKRKKIRTSSKGHVTMPFQISIVNDLL